MDHSRVSFTFIIAVDYVLAFLKVLCKVKGKMSYVEIMYVCGNSDFQPY
jgi:hypothetical protein